ncbi:MAG: TetR/AcrR family transcriptional regulator [Actinomycetia bacterium]|nr:TetR/AcrR family transcriptional regulator [Actinomycetes bacterium]
MTTPDSDLTGRARIREAALRLYAAHGAEAVSLRAVAREAGGTPGLVTHHFGSRAGLYRAVQEHVVEMFRAALDEVAAEGAPRTVAAAKTASLERMLADHPAVGDFVRRELLTPSPDDDYLARALTDLTIEQTAELRAAGTLRRDVPAHIQATQTVVAQLGRMLIGPALERAWQQAGGPSPAPEVRVTLKGI